MAVNRSRSPRKGQGSEHGSNRHREADDLKDENGRGVTEQEKGFKGDMDEARDTKPVEKQIQDKGLEADSHKGVGVEADKTSMTTEGTGAVSRDALVTNVEHRGTWSHSLASTGEVVLEDSQI